jgi:hypothetical protein
MRPSGLQTGLNHICVTGSKNIFYADDGRTDEKDSTEAQEGKDVINNPFELVGLFVNTVKTVSMTNALEHCKGQVKTDRHAPALGPKPFLRNTFVRFHKAVVLNVVLYGSETWKVTKWTVETLEALHNKCVRTIM